MKIVVIYLYIMLVLTACGGTQVILADGVNEEEANYLARQYLRQRNSIHYTNILEDPMDKGNCWKVKVYNTVIHKYMASLIVDKNTGEVSIVANSD